MSSAKQGYPVVGRMLDKRPAGGKTAEALFAELDEDLRAPGARGDPPDAEHRRVIVKAHRSRARLPAGTILPPADF